MGWPFLKSEAGGLVGAFWRPFWKSTLILGLAAAIFLAIRLWGSAPAEGSYQPPHSLGGYLFEGVILVLFSFVYIWPLGVLCGAVGAFWRLFGGWTFFPLVVLPLFLWGLFWVSGDFLAGQGHDIPEAIRAAYEAKGMPTTTEMLGGARVAHAGGPAAVIVLIVLLPALLIDSFKLILDPGVLWQLFQFVFCMIFVLLAGVSLSVLFSSIPLARSFLKRLRKRKEEFIGGKACLKEPE